MSVANTTVWEVRTAGADTNGGGFNSARAGVDYSQQDVAQFSHATTISAGAGSTSITDSTGTGWNANMVGSIVFITGGGATAGWYEIVSITGISSSVTFTIDRALNAGAVAGASITLGGALLSPAVVAGAKSAGNDVHLKAGTYTINTATANVANGVITDSTGGVSDANVSNWIGYQTTRGDNGTKPILNSTATTGAVFTASANHTRVSNIEIQATGGAIAFSMGGNSHLYRCKSTNASSYCILFGSSGICAFCEIVPGAVCGLRTTVAAALVYGCVAHGQNNCPAFQMSAISTFAHCIVYGAAVAGQPAFSILTGGYLLNCVAANNPGIQGFQFSANEIVAINCIASLNGGFGFTNATATEGVKLINCAGFSNTSGNVHTNILGTEGFITLSADPFVNAAAGNFALNNTAGGGAALRGSGILGAFPGNLMTGYQDVGVAQHQDLGGAVTRAFAA